MQLNKSENVYQSMRTSSHGTFSSAPNWGATSAAAMAVLRTLPNHSWASQASERTVQNRVLSVVHVLNKPLGCDRKRRRYEDVVEKPDFNIRPDRRTMMAQPPKAGSITGACDNTIHFFSHIIECRTAEV